MAARARTGGRPPSHRGGTVGHGTIAGGDNPHRDHRNQAGGPDIHDDEKVHDAHHNRERAAAARAAGGDDIDCGHLPA
ncbi:hypothetical protein R1X32_11945 [Rhodococcus opacus]|uniref:hypothetical protein n=1 Tax=Rhodococcus opacus TaxID=37919 RepID=UPI0034D2B877